MRRRLLRLVGFAAALLAFSAVLRGGEAQPGLEAAKEPLGRLVPLAILNDELALDWEQLRHGDLSWRYDQTMSAAVGKLLGDKQDMIQKYVSGSTISRNAALDGVIKYDFRQKTFRLNLIEKDAMKRTLLIEQLDARFEICLSDANNTNILKLERKTGGGSQVWLSENKVMSGSSFVAMLKESPAVVQLNLLRPLADLGIQIAPHPDLPVVMAVATTGFSTPAPETRKKADDLLAQLADDDQATRLNATKELTKLFPQAIWQITRARDAAKDAETKALLEKVIAAHPGIARARSFVEEKNLHEDREYLLGILKEVPFFKAASRARLATLYGKDYGDDPAAWPK